MENLKLELLKRNLNKLKKDLFLLSTGNGQKGILFHKPSLKIYYLKEPYKQIFYELLNEVDDSCLYNWLKKNENIILEFWNEIEFFIKYKINNTSKSLERLALLVSQECGLECKYCYARGGNYGRNSFMNSVTAKRTLEIFVNLFNDIETVQFFGGEPLLNIKCIEETALYVKSLCQKGFLKKKPILNIVTGLGVSKKIIEELKALIEEFSEFKFEVVVSIDGPEIIQNYLRPFKGGYPSFEIIKRNMESLQQINQPQLVEVTYTNFHIKNGFKPSDLKSFFYTEFKIENIMIAPVISKNPEVSLVNRDLVLLGEYQEAINLYQNGNNSKINLINELVNQILEQAPNPYFCGSGINSFVVDSIGNIFPCQLLVDNNDFSLGNVFESKEKLENLLAVSQQKYSKIFDKTKDKSCSNCFLEYFCRGCPIAPILLGDQMKIPYETCEPFKKCIKDSILIKIKEDFLESNY
ncbi:hypothetical protein PW5551_10475 [Petrotoga sp. 9PW.55.5.1]|uniref:radical SAM/SPASM domain-containing protein n=1 Tax=Petrotoga sp. 9PW.55.5.1 TaxID=1308979 RepID=UPI000DC5BFB1|nr:radical SAM protein [Petrotoga sp. 9PW.55.5.1]RAO98339.1 hypothetical protein PW5551_10475 [Petrotoga sp. 9PW.55.5.1]